MIPQSHHDSAQAASRMWFLLEIVGSEISLNQRNIDNLERTHAAASLHSVTVLASGLLSIEDGFQPMPEK